MKFAHTNKRYMHNPESVLENEMHKVLGDFEIRTDHLISARLQRDSQQKKKKKKKRTCRIVNLAVTADYRVKLKENQKRDIYLDLARELKKKTMKHEGDCDLNCNLCAWNNLQRTGKRSGRLGNKRTSG